ncbi:MAG: anaerobic ribonucleoside-triphosphate reductase activating protein [Nanoarchaeota archaeon]|nr:anaerobic ribonucleoside-triphosphate reductase activating protein [Nanoarchaeota archaeon]
MKIKGFQKISLIDYPGKIACILFLAGCNFRCGFCHNPELVLDKGHEIYSENKILDFLEKRKNQLDGVCITGGEPLLSLNLDFLKKIKELNYSIKIDTNGSFPEKLEEIIDKKLVDFIAMDIKASKENYNAITNSDVEINKIEKSIKLISNFGNYEFRTTILKEVHTAEEVKKIAKWLNQILGEKPRKLCLQGFKNKGKLLGEEYRNKKDVEEDYLRELKEAIKSDFEEVEIRS